MLYGVERKEVCEVARVMFDRNLTNAAGGNISVRINVDHVLMTPTLMSQQKYCRIAPEEILVLDNEMNKIEGEGDITREANMHLGVLKELSLANAVIHAHPRDAMVFACLGLPIPLVCEAVEKLGEIIALPYAKACSVELAQTAVEYFKSRGAELEKHALVALLRRHGILVVDRSLKKAYDMLERVETNAYVNLQAKLFEAGRWALDLE
ncbi:methylthioribulose-1-phosphate dehydratase [Peptococcaceae bacterium CEB3]|nr:methylthioribulose-1-phosphate dehydratase [Peptococcaceae bacterium CEB3]